MSADQQNGDPMIVLPTPPTAKAAADSVRRRPAGRRHHEWGRQTFVTRLEKRPSRHPGWSAGSARHPIPTMARLALTGTGTEAGLVDVEWGEHVSDKEHTTATTGGDPEGRWR
jgi:hypothetical protein